MNIGPGRVVELTNGAAVVIITTITVPDLKPPHNAGLASIGALWLTFLSVLLSFVYVAIY